MIRLAVNIDHVATLRQARLGHEPEPVAAALIAEMAGARGITVHLRGDRRHIQDRDLELLRQAISTRLNVEMAVTAEMIEIASRIVPYQVTLVPERPDEVTTEGGLDVVTHAADVRRFVAAMRSHAVRVSLFIDPDERQVEASRASGAEAVEINTGRYAEAREGDAGLEVLAGHGLNYTNVLPLVAIPEIVELNIGHSIVSRATLVGMDRAVRDMVHLLGG
jgi:pyridoxine 5-phosphate synthase